MTDNHNPYQAPSSRIADVVSPLLMQTPDRWRRFVTYLIDYATFVLICALVGMLVGLIAGRSGVVALQKWNLLLGFSVLLGYYIVLEHLFGRTLGKLVMGTRVVDESGGKPTLGQILGRTFSRLIPFEAFSFFGEDKRGWHDKLPGTFVVMAR